MAESAKSLQLVGAGGRAPGLEAFGVALRAVLGERPDLAAEATWQQLGKLVADNWEGLCREQAPLSTWGMLAKCTETITRLRRAQEQAKGVSAADALEEFRQFMGDVMGEQGP